MRLQQAGGAPSNQSGQWGNVCEAVDVVRSVKVTHTEPKKVLVSTSDMYQTILLSVKVKGRQETQMTKSPKQRSCGGPVDSVPPAAHLQWTLRKPAVTHSHCFTFLSRGGRAQI